MTKLVVIITLIIAICFSFQYAFIFEGYCQVSNAFGVSFTEVFCFFWLENSLNLVNSLIIRF